MYFTPVFRCKFFRLEKAKGINLKENAKGDIDMGLHRDTLNDYINSLPVNKAGYINFKLVKRFYPSKKGGYTHQAFRIPAKESTTLV